MAREVDGRAPVDRLPPVYDGILDYYRPPAAFLHPVELEIGVSALRVLPGHGPAGRFPLVRFQSALRDKKLPQGENLVAPDLVGAGARFLLDYAHYHHRTDIFWQNGDLSPA